MGVLPPTGTMISMGRTAQAYNNVPNGSQSVSFANNSSISLNAQIGRPGTQNTPFSNVFGGRTTPFNY